MKEMKQLNQKNNLIEIIRQKNNFSNDICQHNIVADFITVQKTPNTKMLYKAALKNYFDFIKVTPTQYLKQDMRNLSKAKKNKAMDMYSNDLLRYAEYLNNTKSPKTVTAYFSIVKTFLLWNHVELDAVKMDKIKKNAEKAYAVTIEMPLTTELLARLFDHSRGVIERAFFLTMASGGIRPDEALQLQPEDFDFTSSPTSVHVIHDPKAGRTTKTRETRYTFISDEATRCVLAWQKEREAYLVTACAKKVVKAWHGKMIQKNPNDTRMFPFSSEKMYRMWNRLCKKAGIYEEDKRTGINKYRPYMLRKFFNSQMKTMIPATVVEKLDGHSGYLGGVYDKYTLEQLADFYRQGMPSVTVFERKYHEKETKKELDNLRAIVQDLLDQQIKQEAYQQYKQQLADEQATITNWKPLKP